jgi:hypothetical protein
MAKKGMKDKQKDKIYPQDDTMIKDWVIAMLTEGQANQEPFYQLLDEYKEQYESIPYRKTNNVQVADVFIPETFKQIQTVKARLMYYIFGTEFFDIKKHFEIDMEKIVAYKKHINDQMEMSGFETEVHKFVLSMLKNGTAIAKVYEDKKVECTYEEVDMILMNESDGMPVIDPETNEPVIAGKEPQKVFRTKRFPKFKNLNWQNVTVIGLSDNFEELDAVIETVEDVSWEELWANRKRTEIIDEESGETAEVGIYHNLDKALERQIMSELQPKKEDERAKEYLSVERTELPPANKKKTTQSTKHILHECWCYYDLNGDGHKEICIFTVLDRQLLIRKQESPYVHNRIPYLLCPAILKDDDLWGLGMCEIVQSLQHELNAKRNQMLDNTTLNMHSMKIVRDYGIPDEDLVSRPNGIIRSSMQNPVDPLKVDPLNIRDGVLADQMIKDDMSGATGATKSMQGAQLERKGTATEVRSLISEGNYRILEIIMNLENLVFKPYMKMHHANNQQFIEEKLEIEIDNPKKGEDEPEKRMVVLDQKDIMFPFQFDINIVSDVENRTVKTQMLQNYLGLLSSLGLPPQFVMLPQIRIAKHIWAIQGLSDVSEIFPEGMEDQLQAMLGGLGNPLMGGVPPGGPGGMPSTVPGVMNQTVPNMPSIPQA